ncbi:MAG: hypothetical protein OYG31_01285 [Candidatus Kaiserbacteria bacterium]|nr:hypothetical protein [Candidatus Kaiserbacteria bacterium]
MKTLILAAAAAFALSLSPADADVSAAETVEMIDNLTVVALDTNKKLVALEEVESMIDLPANDKSHAVVSAAVEIARQIILDDVGLIGNNTFSSQIRTQGGQADISMTAEVESGHYHRATVVFNVVTKWLNASGYAGDIETKITTIEG